MAQIPDVIPNVTAVTKANVYFDGKVVSHSILTEGGGKQTLGLIYPGSYHFDTEKPERMDIVAGACVVQIDGQSDTATFKGGESFDVPGQSGFTITVGHGICEYLCSFLG